MSAVLVECHRVLLPLVSDVDEVDVDMFPVVIMTMVNTKWITTPLMSVPEMPGDLEELSTTNYFVINWGIRVEWFALAIVLICCFIWITVVICRTIKSSGLKRKI